MNVALIAPYATAQTVLKADKAALQPQISRDSIGFDRCGIRAAVSPFDPQGKRAEAYDFAIMFNATTRYAMIKGGKTSASYDPVTKKFGNLNVTVPAPSNFWLADELDGKPAIMEKLSASPTKGFVIGFGESAPSVKAVRAMMDGRRVQFVMRYKSEKIDKVISFAAKLPPEELALLEKCFADLSERMSAESPAAKKQ